MTAQQSIKTLGRLFLKRTEQSKNHSAIGRFEKGLLKFYSYQEYRNMVEAITFGLIKLGLEPQNKLAILGATTPEWHLMDLATICAKGIVVPIYPSLTPDETVYLINHSESSFVAVDANEQLQKLIKIQDQITSVQFVIVFSDITDETKSQFKTNIKLISYKSLLQMGNEEVKNSPNQFQELVNQQVGSDLASIIYTSGTTGIPKGAMITHHAFVSMLENVERFVHGAFGPEDRTLTFLPLSHVFGRVDSFLPLIFGWQMVFAESMEKLLPNIEEAKPTIMLAVPRVFEKIHEKVTELILHENFIKKTLFDWATQVSNHYYDLIEKDLTPPTQTLLAQKLAYQLVFSKLYKKFGGRIRYLVSGGAPLSPDIIRFLRNANLTVLEGYGLTETVAPCALNPLSRQIPGTVGIPLGDMEFSFTEDNEILIKGEALFSGYYKNEAATTEALQMGWFHTGDIGEFTAEGMLKITDRKKDLIKTAGGKFVAPQKLENLAKNYRPISHLVLIGDKRRYLTAIIAIEKERFVDLLPEIGLPTSCTIAELAKAPKTYELLQSSIDSMNSKLARYETIKKFYIAPEEFSVGNGLLTPSLKVRRKAVFERYKREINAMY